jgi:DNA replication protein DnaC
VTRARLGSLGVGKTHLVVAISREVIVAGCPRLFVPATTLVAALAKAHAEGRLEDKLAHVTKPKLPIVGALG